MSHQVLVVDDSDFVRQAVAAALRQHGELEVLEAKNGKEALDLLADNPKVTGLLLDVKMPIVDGREVLLRIGRPSRRPMFIIAVGSASEKEVLLECLELGADDVLVKPLDVATVCGRLQRGLLQL